MSLRTLKSAIRKDHWCGRSWRSKLLSSFAEKGSAKIKSQRSLVSINPKCPSWLEAVSPDLPATDFFDTSTRSDATFASKSDQIEPSQNAAKWWLQASENLYRFFLFATFFADGFA